jgi:hypothetical protein
VAVAALRPRSTFTGPAAAAAAEEVVLLLLLLLVVVVCVYVDVVGVRRWCRAVAMTS